MQFTTTFSLVSAVLASAVMAAPGLVARTETATIPMTIENYGFIGCYVDDARRFISSEQEMIRPVKTLEECISNCAAKGTKFASIQYSTACFCADEFTRPMRPVSPSACNMKCTGNPNQLCGGPWRNQVYAAAGSTISTPDMCPKPDPKPQPGPGYGSSSY